jgi:hypothetical protein
MSRLLRSQTVWILSSVTLGLVLALVVQWNGARSAAEPSSPADGRTIHASDTGIPAAANMAALAKVPSAGDRALSESSEVRSEIEATVGRADGVAERMLPGGERADSFRTLMTDVGYAHRSIWAITTSKGRVCAGLTDFTSGCISRFASPDEHVTITMGRPTIGAPLIVWGLAPDDVAKVDVVVNGTAQQARLGDNAYYFELANTKLDDEAITALVVTLKADTTPIEIEISPTPDPPDLSG